MFSSYVNSSHVLLLLLYLTYQSPDYRKRSPIDGDMQKVLFQPISIVPDFVRKQWSHQTCNICDRLAYDNDRVGNQQMYRNERRVTVSLPTIRLIVWLITGKVLW